MQNPDFSEFEAQSEPNRSMEAGTGSPQPAPVEPSKSDSTEENPPDSKSSSRNTSLKALAKNRAVSGESPNNDLEIVTNLVRELKEAATPVVTGYFESRREEFSHAREIADKEIQVRRLEIDDRAEDRKIAAQFLSNEATKARHDHSQVLWIGLGIIVAFTVLLCVGMYLNMVEKIRDLLLPFIGILLGYAGGRGHASMIVSKNRDTIKSYEDHSFES